MKSNISILGAAALVLLPSVAWADGAAPVSETKSHTTTPWIFVGVGATVTAVGVLSFVGAVKAHDDVASESAAKGCTTSPSVSCPVGVDATTIQTNLDGERAMNVLGVVLTSVGVVGLVGGLVWHFMEPTGTRPHANVAVTPAIGPGYQGLSFAARF